MAKQLSFCDGAASWTTVSIVDVFRFLRLGLERQPLGPDSGAIIGSVYSFLRLLHLVRVVTNDLDSSNNFFIQLDRNISRFC